jgi:hypothetical protein
MESLGGSFYSTIMEANILFFFKIPKSPLICWSLGFGARNSQACLILVQ